jgi:translation initiation factor 1 (eIF-1/SUI1)
MNKSFKVTVEYRGKVTVTVEAADEKEADTKALAEADGAIGGNLHVYDVQVEEV